MGMLAQRKIEVVEVEVEVRRPKKQKQLTIAELVWKHRMVSFLAVAVMVFLVASTYVGAYAMFMEKGYCKAALLSDLAQVKKENQKLRLGLDASRQPDRIEAFAVANGMKPSQETAYLAPTTHPHMAMNVDHTEIR